MFNLEYLTEEQFRRRHRQTDDAIESTKQAEPTVESWNDFFNGVFRGEQFPKIVKSRVYVKRHLPAAHPDNLLGVEMSFPFQFGFECKGERWFGVLFSLGKNQLDWQFLLFKPDVETYIYYLAGLVELRQLYYTTDEFYEYRPDVLEGEGIKLSPADLQPEMLPAEGTFYNPNIVFDKNDFFFGRNSAEVDEIMEFAKRGEFY